MAVCCCLLYFFFFFSSRRRHTRCSRDWSSDVCSSDLKLPQTSLLTYLAGAIALVGLLLVFRRRLLTFLLHFSTRWALTDAGRRAIEKQPDEIHLVRRDSYTWKNEQAFRGQVEPLLALGFENIGTFAIDNLPAVMVRVLLREEESLYAVVY